VGGIREKVLAAHRAGLKTVIIPEKNEKDLEEIPKSVLKEMELIKVKHMDEVLPAALHELIPSSHITRRKSNKKKASDDSDASKRP
jgi:ATP-dependent Lon protease